MGKGKSSEQIQNIATFYWDWRIEEKRDEFRNNVAECGTWEGKLRKGNEWKIRKLAVEEIACNKKYERVVNWIWGQKYETLNWNNEVNEWNITKISWI